MEKRMTYEELADYIRNMDEEQRQQTVTIFVPGVNEYFPLNEKAPIRESFDSDVLDDKHIFLAI